MGSGRLDKRSKVRGDRMGRFGVIFHPSSRQQCRFRQTQKKERGKLH